MKPRATIHLPALLFWCTVGALMWYGAFVALKAIGLDSWQVLTFLGLLALAGLAWFVGQCWR